MIRKSEHDSGFLFYSPERLQTKKRLIFTLTTSIALFLSAVNLNNTTLASTSAATPATSTQEISIVKGQSAAVFEALPEPMTQEKLEEPIVSIEQYVKTYFAKKPILAEIARCESRFRHFGSDGEVLRGRVVREDVGVMQINERYHKQTSEKLGYDIYTIDGNLAYAEYLYEKQGVRPWSASEACWNK